MARRTSLSKLYSTSQKTFDLWMLRLLYRADVRKDIDTCSFGDSGKQPATKFAGFATITFVMSH